MIVAQKAVVILVYLFCILPSPLYAQSVTDEIRGELLYSIHCVSCHDDKIHWREKNLAVDWQTLRKEVIRWQNNLALDWRNEDIDDVTNYLNKVFYHFPNPQKNDLSDNDLSLQ